ncbi:MAG TPA: hypothetical protein PKA63_11400 [Oligoflexia bacterium]|nr:hypothetical protein [Oligoflexia bacterium]HMP49264.1 hypothetical protein [Oligoflexia bacterium]
MPERQNKITKETAICILIFITCAFLLYFSINKLDGPEKLYPLTAITGNQQSICVRFQEKPLALVRINVFREGMDSIIFKGSYSPKSDESVKTFQGHLSFNPIGFLYESSFEINLPGERAIHLKTSGTSSSNLNFQILKDGLVSKENILYVDGPLLHSKKIADNKVPRIEILIPNRFARGLFNLGSLNGPGHNLGEDILSPNTIKIASETAKYFTFDIEIDQDEESEEKSRNSCNPVPIQSTMPFSEAIFNAIDNLLIASEK